MIKCHYWTKIPGKKLFKFESKDSQVLNKYLCDSENKKKLMVIKNKIWGDLSSAIQKTKCIYYKKQTVELEIHMIK